MDLLALSVAVPLITATLLVAVGHFVPARLADAIALAAVVAAAVLLAVALARVGDGLDVYWFGAWQPRAGIALGIDFAADSLGIGLALFVSVLMAAALVLMWRYRDTDAPHFQVLMLVFFAGMVGFALAGDLFNMFLFFELMSVAAFALTGHMVESESVEGSLNFAITNTVGTFLLLIGIGLAYARSGALNLAQIGHALAGGPADGLVVVAFALLVTGFLIKAAIVPFHFWLADAYAVAPSPVCLLFAGAMTELGLYGVGRLWFTAFEPSLGAHADSLRTVLIVAGCLTAVLGAVMCLPQQNLKRMLAFVTISYSGVALIGAGLLDADGISGAALYTISDGFGKAALLGAVGIVASRFGQVGTGRLFGAARNLGATGAVMAFAALSLLAIPPFGSFSAKAMLEEALQHAGYGWAIAVLIVAAGLTTAAVIAAAARVFLGIGERPDPSDASEEDQQEELSEPQGRTPPSLFLPTLALALAALATGLFDRFATAIEQAADRFVDTATYVAVVIHGAAPQPIHEPPSFEPKPGAYGYALLSVALAVVATLWALYPTRLRALTGERMAAAADRALAGLRALHSGHVGDYIAFICAGAALLGGAFAVALR